MRISAAFFLSFSLASSALAAGPGTFYFTAVQNGDYGFKGGGALLEESYKALQGMVKLADERNVELTLLFSAQYAAFIASDTARLGELAGWRRSGHEIGAYHQGPETAAWDGYSDLGAEELARLRSGAAASGGSKEYFAALALLEPAPKTGCMRGGSDSKFLAAAPPYEICLRSDLAGASGAAAGVNEAVFVPPAGGDRRFLSSFSPSDKAGIAAAQDAFSGMGLGVYGASFRGTPAEFGVFYAWLKFLTRQDPQGLRSRTVAAAVAGGLLEEKKTAPPAAKKTGKKKALPALPLSKPAAVTERPREPLKLRPIRSFLGRPSRIAPTQRGVLRSLPRVGWCGDGVCDVFERAQSGACKQDCGE
jgi:hypothetical protein